MELKDFTTAFLMPAAIVIAAVEPELAEVKGTLPNGKKTAIRLMFKKGVVVNSKDLPSEFISASDGSSKWIQFDELTPKGKEWALRQLFKDDVWTENEVLHKVRWEKLESVWLLSTLFTGHGQNYDKLLATNPGNPEPLTKNSIWRIPKSLLSPDFGGSAALPDKTQPEDELSDEARMAVFREMLSFEKDTQGEYAAYKLRRGETLYSSVVLRFTDLDEATEVNQLANRIAKRSGIDNVRTIQPGQLIKIPLDSLAAPFQPEGSRELAEERQLRADVRRTTKIEAGPRLSGVRIVLDPGHGGNDPGARGKGVWESDFVYDVAMRVRRLLELNTDAQILTTLRYEGIGFGIRERIPAITKNAVLQTTPPLQNDRDISAATGANLRWVMANSFFAVPKMTDSRKTLFISFHADSLHPDKRGTMVYIPASHLVQNNHSFSGRGLRVAELKRGANVSFSERQKRESEAQSLIFAEGLLKALRQQGIKAHPNRPIRNVIKRAGRSYVPAVIRSNTATTKVLIEIVNLKNENDAELLKDPNFREKYAEAVVRAIRAHYKN